MEKNEIFSKKKNEIKPEKKWRKTRFFETKIK